MSFTELPKPVLCTCNVVTGVLLQSAELWTRAAYSLDLMAIQCQTPTAWLDIDTACHHVWRHQQDPVQRECGLSIPARNKKHQIHEYVLLI